MREREREREKWIDAIITLSGIKRGRDRDKKLFAVHIVNMILRTCV